MTSLAIGSLLVNAALSLLGAWLFAAVLRRALRRPAWAKAALLLPFVKMVVDLARGIGPDAYVRSAHAGTKWELGNFRINVGLWRPFLPRFEGILGARWGDRWYTLSGGDLPAHVLHRKLGPAALTALVAAVLAVSFALALRRILAAIVFERARRRDRRSATAIGRARLLFREVDVYVSEGFHGAPFTGGLLRPYVCIPADAHAALDDDERAAALAHELGHARALDAPLFLLLGLLTDLAWFVPGIRRLLASIRTEAERAADESAVRTGADPLRLASAIACLAERGVEPAGAVPFTTAKSPVARRIGSLLAPSRATDPRWRLALRGAAAIALAHAALFSTFLTHR